MLHLRYFVAVAEELNFSQAARRLHIAASPLSQRIKDLEHELQQQLFERSTHRVALTEAGAALLPLARDVLERVNAIPWRLREATSPQRVTLFIGMPAAVHPVLRERLRELEERVSERFELKRWPGASPRLLEAVKDARLALSLVRLPAADPALEVLPVLSERLGAAVPADRFPGRTSIRLAELTDLAYAPLSGDGVPAFFEQLDTRLADAGLRQRVRITSGDHGGAAELISSGIAFSMSVLNAESPIQAYRIDGVTVLPVEDFPAEMVTALVWRRDRAQAGGDLVDLVGQLREVFAEQLSR